MDIGRQNESSTDPCVSLGRVEIDEQPTGDKPVSFRCRRWTILATLGVGFAFIFFLRRSGFQGVDVQVTSDAVIYSLSVWWLPVHAIPVVMGLVLGLVVVTIPGFFSRVFGGLVLLITIGMAIIAIPLHGNLVVTSDGFSHTAGFWWEPDTVSVRFEDLSGLRLIEPKRSRGAPSFVLECHEHDGEVVKIPKSTVLEAGLEAVFARARQHGVKLDIPLAEAADQEHDVP